MSADESFVVLGCGGHAQVVCETVRRTGSDVRGYVAPSRELSRLGAIPRLGDDEGLPSIAGESTLVNGIGSSGRVAARADAYDRASAQGLRFATIVDPTAVVFDSAVLYEGVVVLAGAVIGAGSVLQADVLINTGAIVDHDARIGAHTHISPGAVLAGDVTVGERSHIGLGARVIQGVTVGSSCVVGAGAVVLEDVPDGTTVVGVPARAKRVKP